jgi:predicted DCC family thiol-disulfide oxidoreductase YuxK
MIPTDMARDPTGSVSGRWIVLYDADCGFCRWSLARLLALDRTRRLQPVALGTAQANTLLSDLTEDQRAASWHLVAPDGRRASGGTAAVPLLQVLPGGRPAAALLARAPRLTERTYQWVVDHRSLLSRALPAKSKQRATDRIEKHAAVNG